MLPKRDIAFVRNDKDTPKTQLIIVVGLLVLAMILRNDRFVYASLGIGLSCLIFPAFGYWLVWAWYKLAELLSKVMNPLILGLMYFLFISPIAILFRLFGNDPMRLKDKKGSLFEIREHSYKKEDLENPW